MRNDFDLNRYERMKRVKYSLCDNNVDPKDLLTPEEMAAFKDYVKQHDFNHKNKFFMKKKKKNSKYIGE